VLSLALAGRERDALDELELCGSQFFFCLFYFIFWFVVTCGQLYGYSYLPSPPYQDNPVLHTYAGLICLRLAQWNNKLSGDTQGTREAPKHMETVELISLQKNPEQRSDQIMLREARQYLERARALDPEVVPPAFICKVRQPS
jgi:hypothetical protein